jgi:hypothetical protein
MDDPPWIAELTYALGVAYAYLRLQKGDKKRGAGTLADVTQSLADARRAGWAGADKDFWRAATTMSAFTGAMPWHPQKAFVDAEVKKSAASSV